MVVGFLDDGNLYPGIHTYAKNEFEQQFINGFSTSTSRAVIYTNFSKWVKQLMNVLKPRYIWLDGSYLTTKVNPNDIDLVVFYSPEDITTQNQSDNLSQIINVLSRKLTCDAYISLTFDFTTSQVEQAVKTQNPESATRQTYWMGQFGYDRNRQPKGIIQFDQNELFKF